VLGGEPGEPLPPEWLPAAAARLERALGAAVQEIFLTPPPRTEANTVRGLGVSPGVYLGTARVIRGTSEFGRIEPGDVLVTNSTTTAFNIVLPLLGAIVTDRGGLLSHAAIVAREFGIPGVVGCTDATAVLPDGARVRVDGTAGEAQVVS
jgi:pyruvate,water dikinase